MFKQKAILKVTLFYLCLVLFSANGYSQQVATAPGNGNPIIPGYFADPTVKKFGDTYYIYATTDGNGGGLGPSQVWTSKDFVNWTMQDMNWPTTHNYWAPDVALGTDGKYYLYYCQPTVEIYGASASTPTGPWTPLFADGKPVLTNLYVPGVITLDGQTFKDDDGKFYMTWGTWGIYPGYGCGVGVLNPDMRSFAKTAKIPNTDATDFFEGSFMFKRKGIYYLLYSSGFCENETYRVQYATSKTSPMAGFVYGKNNPILATNADGTVHGPGHNSVLQVGDDYYIIYHRHNNPHSGGGYNRQVCADKLVFDTEGNIEKVVATHTGIGLLAKSSEPYPNLVYQKKVTASSFYNNDYKPEFAVDDNNGTLWKPKDNSTAPAWLQVDLGKVTTIKKILTQFEYATWYYQYLIQYSVDGKQWQTFADKRNNHWHGSPAIDEGDVKARYVKITITGTEYPGLYKAIWNFKIYGGGAHEFAPPNIHQSQLAITYNQQGLLIDIDADKLQAGTLVKKWANYGTLGGAFQSEGKAPVVDFVAGKKAVVFNGSQSLSSTFNVPRSLAGNNSYTVSFWAYTNELKDENPLLTWTKSTEQLTGATFGYGSNHDMGAAQHFGYADIPFGKNSSLTSKWHHVAITFDGTFEKVFVDGELNNQENKMLFVQCADNFLLGTQNNSPAHFSGAIASLQVYDRALTDTGVKTLFKTVKKADVVVYLNAAKLPYGKLKKRANDGDAGGTFVAGKASPEVTDAGGRIAFSFKNGESFTLNAPLDPQTFKGNYSVAAMVYTPVDQNNKVIACFGASANKSSAALNFSGMPGKWHLIVKTYNGKTATDYVDGTLARTYAQNRVLNSKDSLRIGEDFTGALASLVVYRQALTVAEVKTITSTAFESLHPPVGANLNYKQVAKAISPNMIDMEAGNDDLSNADGLQYYFTNLDATGKSNSWVNEPYFVDYGLSPNKRYNYSYKVRDIFGNVTANAAIVSASTDTGQFISYADNFATSKDYLLTGTKGAIWDGLVGKSDTISAKHNSLKLASQGTNWDGGTPYGPFLYKNVKGNFIAEVELTDITGFVQKKVAGNNEAGLMVRAVRDTTKINSTEQLLQNGIFPAWNVGNMFTNFVDGDRRQANTQSSWNFNRYLQIERRGNLFYIRTSNDAINWVDMPGSPALRTDLNEKEVQVGLYQCTYGPKPATGSFSNFRLFLLR
ncbi:family 43 glycosylhydrolase [Mucilaginibacter sp. FT3.2]|uniref:family 43 glycosylhydrolase n=1 Tax=Mucilaginibacter sp. FT3.2 TaxID=2723090 RepID=UPI00160D84D8|nr:family 43 glycosylhydrolase [Mucilaginibacter sp. FT3.2]MBB6231628.1 hypothetical protein [Mucilaginibacter sp. FT3.2]